MYLKNLTKYPIGEIIMDQLIIREVRQEDAKSLRENIFSRDTLSEVRERIACNILKMQSGKLINLVAVNGGNSIGNILLKREEHPFYQHRCNLEDVIVNPAYHRMGIARKLFDECVKAASASGINIITASCRGGEVEAFYTKLGFKEYGRIPEGIIEPWGNKNTFDEVWFYKYI
jgi:predicted N-acetyltransferase YhbS